MPLGTEPTKTLRSAQQTVRRGRNGVTSLSRQLRAEIIVTNKPSCGESWQAREQVVMAQCNLRRDAVGELPR